MRLGATKRKMQTNYTTQIFCIKGIHVILMNSMEMYLLVPFAVWAFSVNINLPLNYFILMTYERPEGCIECTDVFQSV